MRLYIVLCIAFVMIIFGCQAQVPTSPSNVTPDATSPQISTSTETITFATFDVVRESYAALAQQFEQESSIHVEVLSLDELMGNESINLTDNLEEIADTTDTFAVQLDTNIVQQNILYNLTPLMEADQTFERDDFYPAALAAVQTQGDMWAVPSLIRFDMIAYDKDAFDQAGVLYPELGWDWDDFLSKAQALTQRNGDDVTRWGFAQSFLHPLSIIASYANLPALDQTALHLDAAPIIDALRWYTNLALQHHVAPLEQLLDDGTAYNLIGSGHAAMWDAFLGDALKSSIGVMPYPNKNDNEHNAQIYLSTYVMSAGTQHPQAGWRWLVFLSHHLPASSNPITALPARQSLAAQIDFWDNLDQATADTYHFILDHADTHLHDTAFSNALDAAAAAVLRGASPERALADAQTAYSGQAAAPSVSSTPIVVATQPPAGQGEFTLRFIYQIDDIDPRPYQALAREFQTAHPEVQVIPRESPLIGEPTFASASKISDCFVWPNGWESLDISKLNQYALNLQPLIDADPTFPLDDFYPTALEAFRTQGDLWAIPAEFRPATMIQFNKDLFDAAGLDYPHPGWTLDDFLSAAVTLTNTDTDRYGFLSSLSFPGITMGSIFAPANGAFYFSDDRDPPRPLFDDPKTIEALQWYLDLVNVHGIDRVPGEDPSLWWLKIEEYDWRLNNALLEKRQGLIRDKHVAMWLTEFLRGYPRSVAPLPLREGGYIRGSFDGFYISATTQYPQLCWEWLRFISDRSSQYARYGPVRQSAYTLTGYAERVGQEFADTMRYSLEHTLLERADEAAANQIGLQYYGTWFDNAMRAAYLQEQILAVGLGQVQDKVEALILCLDNRDGFGNEAIQKECALQVDPATQ